MGLFGNSQTKEFKNKQVDVLNLITNFSYGELPMSTASTIETTINANYNQLKTLYNRFQDPFSECFSFYTSFFSGKISVAEGMYITGLAKELAFQGNKISTGILQQIVREANTLSNYPEGKLDMMSAIRNS